MSHKQKSNIRQNNSRLRKQKSNIRQNNSCLRKQKSNIRENNSRLHKLNIKKNNSIFLNRFENINCVDTYLYNNFDLLSALLTMFYVFIYIYFIFKDR